MQQPHSGFRMIKILTLMDYTPVVMQAIVAHCFLLRAPACTRIIHT